MERLVQGQNQLLSQIKSMESENICDIGLGNDFNTTLTDLLSGAEL